MMAIFDIVKYLFYVM